MDPEQIYGPVCAFTYYHHYDCVTSMSLPPPLCEKGSGIIPKDHSRPADILVPNWFLSRLATFDIKLINPLNLPFLQAASLFHAC